MDTDKRYKGFFAFAPVWITDPEGECLVQPRHIGHVLFPFAEVFIDFCNLVLSLNPMYMPCYPLWIWGYEE